MPGLPHSCHRNPFTRPLGTPAPVAVAATTAGVAATRSVPRWRRRGGGAIWAGGDGDRVGSKTVGSDTRGLRPASPSLPQVHAAAANPEWYARVALEKDDIRRPYTCVCVGEAFAVARRCAYGWCRAVCSSVERLACMHPCT
eukprot:169318-Chlamydomonas_euryale.AAC.4